jgi:hypothetical protein
MASANPVETPVVSVAPLHTPTPEPVHASEPVITPVADPVIAPAVTAQEKIDPTQLLNPDSGLVLVQTRSLPATAGEMDVEQPRRRRTVRRPAQIQNDGPLQLVETQSHSKGEESSL